MRIAIDLVWLKPKKMGGVESFVVNLLKGLSKLYERDDSVVSDVEFVLILAQNNASYLDNLLNGSNCFQKYIAHHVNSLKVVKRIMWENLFLDRLVEMLNVDVVYVPVYSKPFATKHPYVITFHDLQALHYPEYFSFIKNMWLRLAWRRSLSTATKVIAISNYVRQDILQHFKIDPSKIEVIYNPVCDPDEFVHFGVIQNKYAVENKRYFYTVASLLPHKNLMTLLKVTLELRKLRYPVRKLVISGPTGSEERKIRDFINENDLVEDIILTGYIGNAERNTLYKYAYAFLFPSLFEGFGMPPIEAMMLHTPVITTKCSAIPEVTMNKAVYVDDPFSVSDWISKIRHLDRQEVPDSEIFSEYKPDRVARKYVEAFLALV